MPFDVMSSSCSNLFKNQSRSQYRTVSCTACLTIKVNTEPQLLSAHGVARRLHVTAGLLRMHARWRATHGANGTWQALQCWLSQKKKELSRTFLRYTGAFPPCLGSASALLRKCLNQLSYRLVEQTRETSRGKQVSRLHKKITCYEVFNWLSW